MQKEIDLQEAVAKYLALQYSKVLYCHIPNGFFATAKEKAKFKRQGLREGMPDIMIFKPKTVSVKINESYTRVYPKYFGLAIELKVKGGKIQDSQWKALEQLGEAGWKTHICYSFDEAKEVIDDYLQ